MHDVRAGDVLGHFRIRELLGRGGMGEVWAAEDLRLRRLVALKILSPEARAAPERLARFRREAEVLPALNHPNIVTVFDVDEVDGVPFFAMEHVDGTSLAERIPPAGLHLAELLEL